MAISNVAAGEEEPQTVTLLSSKEKIMGDNATTDDNLQQIKTNIIIVDDSSDKTETHNISNEVRSSSAACDDAKEEEVFEEDGQSDLEDDDIICNNTNNCKDGEDGPPTTQLMETNEEKDAPIVYDDNRLPVKGAADSTSVECSESVKEQINDIPSDSGASSMSNNIDGENNPITVDELTLNGTNASMEADDGNDKPTTTELDSPANVCDEVDQQQTNNDDDTFTYTGANNSDRHKNNGNTNEGIINENAEEMDRFTEIDVKQHDKCNGADDEHCDDFVPVEIDNQIQSADSIDANFVLPSTVTSRQPIPSENNVNSNNALSPPPTRRKILRHPILTPLTKLPWDRFISAAGACDALFNCKYSMKQVEDEVREEHTRTIGGHYLENGGYQEDMVGREDGYVNLSLGNEYEGYHYGEEECDADEFAELGLGCCSMLDSEADEEVEVVAHVNSLEEKGEEQCQPSCNEDEEEGNWEEVNVKKEGEDEHNEQRGKPSISTLPLPDSSLLSDQQKADASWKNSNK